MKQLKEIIYEKLKINSKSKINEYKYFPKDRNELKKLVDNLIKERGYDANLNDIDTSEITDMHSLFLGTRFNGDISEWNVSNVVDLHSMFRLSKFDGDISKWDVSNVTNMSEMFEDSQFNGDISVWDVSNVVNTNYMFDGCPLEKNPPKWYN